MSVINTNVKSIVAQNALTVNNRAMSKTMEQLSTGKRINGAKDDAAGLAISSKMTSQIKGLNQAVRNANDGISLIQVAEGSLVEVSNMMQRMRELAVQSANDTNTSDDRSAMNVEFQELKKEINRIGGSTEWNSMKVMDKSFDGGSGTFKFQVGANAAQNIEIELGDYRTSGGTTSAISSVTTTAGGTQVNTLTFGVDDVVKSGSTLTFTMDAGPDGTAQTYKFTATQDLRGGTAIVDALVADDNFEELLGLTAADNGLSVKFTGANTSAYTLSVASATGAAVSDTAPADKSATGFTTTATLAFTSTDRLASGDKLEFTINDGTDDYKATFTAGSDLFGSDAITAAVAAATLVFSDGASPPATLAATTAQVGDTGLSFTAATGTYTLAMAVTSSAPSAYAAPTVAMGDDTFTATAQTSKLTLSGTYAAGDEINIDLADGKTYKYEVTATMTADQVAAAINTDATAAGLALGLNVSKTGTGEISLVGSSNKTFAATATVNNSTGGDLAMINGSNVSSQADSNAAITAIDAALKVVNTDRAKMGAVINRLNSAADNMMNVSQNTSESRSRIMDTDYAQATTELARTQIISQAATAMLAQANQAPQSVLSLLR